MRKFIFLAILAAMAIPASAIRLVTVRQLQQLLQAKHTEKKSDASIAEMVDTLELTEQLTRLTLERVKTEIDAGPKTIRALELVADASLFLAPPASELPVEDPPPFAAQKIMIAGAVRFAGVTLRQLPDLLATRVTRRYDDSPGRLRYAGPPPHLPMSLATTFSEEVAYRDGHETPEIKRAASTEKTNPASMPAGVLSKGEFGPLLAVVLVDASKGRLRWSRWEETSTGRAAVFHYQVPKDVSHYKVMVFCCAADAKLGQSASPFSYNGMPGYHGDLYLDPETGAVRRVTVVPEFDKSEPVTRVAESVEYAKVEIAGKSYDCPVQSIALLSVRNPVPGTRDETTADWLNEVNFTNYHRFGSTVTMVAVGPVP